MRIASFVLLSGAFFLSTFLFSIGAEADSASSSEFRFVILGDRQGGVVPGVFEEALRETDADRPDFIMSVGDTIEGGDDLTMDAQWQGAMSLLQPYSRYRIFLVPGNHDVWSVASAQAFEKYSHHPLHYSFDYKQAHFTVLDNSRTDEMPAEEIAYLRKDLELHEKQPLKFVFSHRPSWILQVFLHNSNFPLAQLAKRYGVQYIIAGHVHEMMHFKLDAVDYISIASSGGHLRDTKSYEKGWFFGHTVVTVKDEDVSFEIKEEKPPFGEGPFDVTRQLDGFESCPTCWQLTCPPVAVLPSGTRPLLQSLLSVSMLWVSMELQSACFPRDCRYLTMGTEKTKCK